MILNKNLYGILLVLSTLSGISQSILTGKVVDELGQPVVGANIRWTDTYEGTVSGPDGEFQLAKSSRTTALTISCIGYKTSGHNISTTTEDITIALTGESTELDIVEVTDDRKIMQLKSSGLNVDIIDMSQYQDLNVDVNQVLNASAGVNIRESGGLGSNFNLSLNGLSGNQIRYFIDGVPMEFYGSSLSLNNIPVNLIRSVEVYKGVVPVALSSDALGGAIQVTTPGYEEQLLDASYAYGSFNTHRASVFGQAHSAWGGYMRVSSFFNHSDNNYIMNEVPVSDELGNISEVSQVRRFHDDYTSGSFQITSGLFDLPWINDLSVGLTYAGNSNNIQHPDVSINRVFGGLNSRNTTILGSARLQRDWANLSVVSNLQFGEIKDSFYDTLSRRYNWEGDFRPLSSPTDGEYYNQHSIFHREDQIFRANLKADYAFQDVHIFTFNVMASQLQREGRDELNPNNLAFSFPNSLFKQVSGLSYQYVKPRFSLSSFFKQYGFAGTINAEQYVGDGYENVESTVELFKIGWGSTIGYNIASGWKLDLSYEKAFRLPETDEILGNGVFITPNSSLRPESSHNVNIGVSYKNEFSYLPIRSKVNVFFRPAQNFIRYVNDRGIYGSYYNIANVRILGAESTTDWNFAKKWSVGLNLTYQSITDQTRKYEGLPNTNFGNKVPNTPYLFGNTFLRCNLLESEDQRLSFTWNGRYVHEFFLYWEHLGFREDKNLIPIQFIQDLDINYVFGEGRYGASASIRNLLDTRAYDNFNIQKPGRSIYLKIRYFISK